jgi:hypothetical protein
VAAIQDARRKEVLSGLQREQLNALIQVEKHLARKLLMRSL